MAKLDFVYICEHAMRDDEGKPCVIGIIQQVDVPVFPAWCASLTIAVCLIGEPQESLDINIQFGASMADVMRDGHFTAKINRRGFLFVPFRMPQLRFDQPGTYVARVIVNEEILFPTRSILLAIAQPAGGG